MCLCAVALETNVDQNNVVEREEERRAEGRRKEGKGRGSEAVRANGKEQTRPGNQNPEKSEKLSRREESEETSDSGLRTDEFHVCDGDSTW